MVTMVMVVAMVVLLFPLPQLLIHYGVWYY